MTDERVLVDTNVLIHQLNGDQAIERLLQGRKVHISFITEVELLSFPGYTAQERSAVKAWLNEFIISDVNEGIKTIAIDLRSRFKLKLADAFVAATAVHWSIPLITQDKHFRKLKKELEIVEV
ncbi:MAG: PIN domain-containing protein [Flavobacteriales bacterium]